jgi:diaminopimelate decarboxylase
MNPKNAISTIDQFNNIYTKPILIYFWETIENNIKEIKNALKTYGVEIVFPVKAFPYADFLARMPQLGIGFDVSRKSEYRLVEKFCYETETVTYSGVIPLDFKAVNSIIGFHNVICEPNTPHYAYRININRSGLRFSHFGVAEWRNIHNRNDIKNIHIHLSDVSRNTEEFYELFISAIVEIAETFPNLEILDIGGGWDKIYFTSLINLVKEIRSLIGNRIRIIIEPGNLIFKDAGFLITKVVGKNRYYNKNIIYLDSCREAHAKWSNPKLVNADQLQISDNSLVLCGCSCDENDVFGLYKTAYCPSIKELLMFSDITPYSAAWNTSFNGIEKAEMIIYE